MSYRLKRIIVKNLRKIKSCDLDITGYEGLIRVGGLNGAGKSTVFYTGFMCLLGLTPMKPHVTKGHKTGKYEVENGFGRFGVKFSDDKTHFYYSLNSGETDSSTQPVNFNNCLDVIRRYIGFDYSAQFKSVLNLNSKDKLMFVHTNGRNDLEFMKQYIYSEEIERAQERCLEDEKYYKNKIDEVSTQIQYLYQDIGIIKTIEPKELKDCIKYVEDIVEWQKSIEKMQSQIEIISKNLYEYENLLKERVSLIKRSLEINLTSVVYSKLKIEYLEYKRMNIKVNNMHENVKELSKLSVLLDQTDFKKELVILLKMKQEVKDFRNIIEDIEKAKLNKDHLETKLLKEKVSEDLLTLKISNIDTLKNKAILYNYIKGFYGGFNLDLTIFSKNFLQKFKLLSDILYSEMKNIEKTEAILKELKLELDKEIFKDGRCILCLSPKGCDHSENLK